MGLDLVWVTPLPVILKDSVSNLTRNNHCQSLTLNDSRAGGDCVDNGNFCSPNYNSVATNTLLAVGGGYNLSDIRHKDRGGKSSRA